jgi:alkanesulfonate monooxygenase SsuD/methylene tetrahydromethanopterin reductase-like flavin-dependent oxidoreductase (luciferase family)
MFIDLVLDPTDRSAGEIVDAAKAAEDLGFSAVWTYDHLSGSALGGHSTLDVWTLLGAIAQATSTVAVGPLVTNVTTRHPAFIALAAATLQDLAGGRAMVGLGAGAGPSSVFSREMQMVGMQPRPAAERRAMVVEAVGVIRGLWSGRADIDGDFFGLTGATGFLRPDPMPPLIVGCNGPKLTSEVAPVADGVNFHSYEPELRRLVDLARSAATSEDFIVTVEAPIQVDDVAAEDGLIEDMRALDVDRLMLRWPTESGITHIEKAAARLLG